MPTISMFYGILIRMFFYDADRHNVPDVHAEYQGQVAVYSIRDGSVLAGELPPKKHKLVSRGLKYTKKICLLTGNWPPMARNYSRFEDLTNEYYRNYSAR